MRVVAFARVCGSDAARDGRWRHDVMAAPFVPHGAHCAAGVVDRKEASLSSCGRIRCRLDAKQVHWLILPACLGMSVESASSYSCGRLYRRLGLRLQQELGAHVQPISSVAAARARFLFLLCMGLSHRWLFAHPATKAECSCQLVSLAYHVQYDLLFKM